MSRGADETDVKGAWQLLAKESKAQLIDVRTSAEWSYVGLPDLTSIAKMPILLEWVTFPGNQKNNQFTDQLQSELSARGVGKGDPLLFICRSGQRSLAAATAMAELGYTNCINVAGGFEGGLDQSKHRGTTSGWKSEKLPWVQS